MRNVRWLGKYAWRAPRIASLLWRIAGRKARACVRAPQIA
jgi:hypothetical protein